MQSESFFFFSTIKCNKVNQMYNNNAILDLFKTNKVK